MTESAFEVLNSAMRIITVKLSSEGRFIYSFTTNPPIIWADLGKFEIPAWSLAALISYILHWSPDDSTEPERVVSVILGWHPLC